MSLFRDRTALVTGASRGIGEALAVALAERGCRLRLCARSREDLDRVAARIAQRFPSVPPVEIFVADLSTEAGVGSLLAAERSDRPTDILVNNAGFGSIGHFQQCDLARQVAMLRLNVESVLRLTHALLPGMLTRRVGGVINLASLGGLLPMPYMATYGATKAFVLSWSEALWAETRGSGVRVVAVCPGPVPTDFGRAAGIPETAPQNPGALTAEHVAEAAVSAYEADRNCVVPGLIPKLVSVAARVMPRGLLARMTARRIRTRMPKS